MRERESYVTFRDQRSSQKLRMLSIYVQNEWQGEVFRNISLFRLYLFQAKN